MQGGPGRGFFDVGVVATLITTDKAHRQSQICRPRESSLLSSRLDGQTDSDTDRPITTSMT